MASTCEHMHLKRALQLPAVSNNEQYFALVQTLAKKKKKINKSFMKLKRKRMHELFNHWPVCSEVKFCLFLRTVKTPGFYVIHSICTSIALALLY